MDKKVVLDVADFEKLAVYINRTPVNFQYVEKAVEVKEILKRAVIMELEIKEKA